MHGCTAAESGDIHVTVPYSHSARSRTGLVVHQNRFSTEDVVHLGGLPVLAKDLALADFLCDGAKRQAFASIDQALFGLDADAVAQLKAEINARLAVRDDPRGVARAVMLTKLATGKAESPPESIFRLIVVENGLPVPIPQLAIRTIDGDVLYRLDMAWEAVRTALEFDGYAAHENRAAHDAERERRLAKRGWVVVRARAADLANPTRVLTELREAFQRGA
ncbi:MAG: endonuclease domain-containing protein [Thermocrispum sp.]